jgi:hypothetical protein
VGLGLRALGRVLSRPGRHRQDGAALSREFEAFLAGDVEAGVVKPGDAKPGVTRPGDTKPGDAKPAVWDIPGSLRGTPAPQAVSPPLRVGIEHEYRVVMRDDPLRRVDFRTMVHELALGRRHLDPDDPFAYRLHSGNVVTCDGPEAEIVLAPMEVGPGAATSIVATGEAERSALAARLPETLELVGHSTHVSVSVPTDLVEAVGRRFAASFAVDVIRLVDSPDRCGVWVRPRPERLELCLDFVDGDRLAGVIAFAVAATETCRLDALGALASSSLAPPAMPGSLPVSLPPAVRLTPKRPRQRSGWNLPLRAVAGDPFDRDGSSSLELAAGGQLPAGEHLAIAWRSIWDLATSVASSPELEVVDRLVSGGPAEAAPGGVDLRVARLDADGTAIGSAAQPHMPWLVPPSPFGDALVPRDRGNFEVGVVALTWPFAVFLVLGRRRFGSPRRAFVCVPSGHLPQFLGLLDAGALDEVFRRYLAARGSGRLLADRDQATRPGLFDELGVRRSLLPREPEVSDVSLDRSDGALDDRSAEQALGPRPEPREPTGEAVAA